MGAKSSSQRKSPKADPEVSKTNKASPAASMVHKSKEEHKKPLEHKQEEKMVPHKYESIIKDADNVTPHLHDQIREGIFLNNKRKKYWVEEQTGRNCFMLFARDLVLTWNSDPRCWKWIPQKETSDEEIEVAALLNICWLEVNGEFDTSYLTPETLYEVAFMVWMDLGYGWDQPVTLKLTLPDGTVQQHEERLDQYTDGIWFELKVGEFKTRLQQDGKLNFSLVQLGQWKRGLIVKGAIFRPMK